MSKFRIGRKWWLAALAVVLLLIAVPFAVMTLLWSGWTDDYVRRIAGGASVIAERRNLAGTGT